MDYFVDVDQIGLAGLARSVVPLGTGFAAGYLVLGVGRRTPHPGLDPSERKADMLLVAGGASFGRFATQPPL